VSSVVEITSKLKRKILIEWSLKKRLENARNALKCKKKRIKKTILRKLINRNDDCPYFSLKFDSKYVLSCSI